MPRLFTSVGLRRQEVASQVFVDNLNPGQVACPVSQASIYALPQLQSALYSVHKDNIGTASASILLNRPLSLGEANRALHASNPVLPSSIIPPPPIVVSFEGQELREQVSTQMSGLGFTKESTGFRVYYKGNPSEETVKRIAQLGGQINTSAPYGASSIQGFLAFTCIQRFYIAAVASLRKPLHPVDDYTSPCSYSEEASSYIFSPDNFGKVFIRSAEEAAGGGIFMPYFNGLTLPDKDHTASFIIGKFQLALGENTETRARASVTLREGWRSAATSGPGMALSHAVFCLEIALSLGAKPVALLLNNVYSGTVLQGRRIAVLKGSTLIRAVKTADLRKEIQDFNTHDTSLAAIAAILCNISPSQQGETELITVQNINTPRRLHEALRARKIGPEDAQSIRKEVNLLKYDSALWDLDDNEHLQAAFNALIKGEYLSALAPITTKGEALFTKDPIISTLAAFGARAPSLLGSGSTITFPVKRSNTYTKEIGGKTLRGIPIFFKPLQQAAEDWKTLRASSTIHFKCGNNDKQGFTKVANVSRWWEFGDSHSKNLQTWLGLYISDAAKNMAAKKRKAGDREDAQDKIEEARIKRLKKTVAQGPSEIAMFFSEQLDLGSGFAEITEELDMEVE